MNRTLSAETTRTSPAWTPRPVRSARIASRRAADTSAGVPAGTLADGSGWVVMNRLGDPEGLAAEGPGLGDPPGTIEQALSSVNAIRQPKRRMPAVYARSIVASSADALASLSYTAIAKSPRTATAQVRSPIGSASVRRTATT